MTGIAGIIHAEPRPHLSDALQRMVGRMHHDPTWVSGHCSFDRPGVHVGWVARPDSNSGCLPGWNADRRICLFFAGEEFSVRKRVSDGADASPLVHSYQHFGDDFFGRLNGWFSGLIVDLRRETVTLFNDRYGLGRIYVREGKGTCYFASEAKSLLAVLPETRALDQRGVAELFAVGCVMQNRTLFSNITLLPPGSAWTFHRDGRVEKRQYFDAASWERQPALAPDAYRERLRSVFARVANRYVQGNARVGMSLTGGLDSRAVMAWSQALPGSLPCYTFGGPYRECADVRIARRLAEICAHPHTTIRVGEDFFSDFARLAENAVYLSDGAMDVSGAVELHVNRQARGIAPVRLTGNYGSEILRSHIAFRPRVLDRSLFTPEFCALLDEAAVTYQREAAMHRLSFIAFKQVPWHHYARLSVEKSQLTLRSPFLDNELVALAFQAPRELAGSPQPLLQLIAEGNPTLATVGTDRALRADARSFVSRMAKAWQEFTAKAEYAYDYGMPRWLARTDRALTKLHLERLFLGRHKFYHFRIWYRDQLRNHVGDAGAQGRAPEGVYRDGAVRRIAQHHVSGRANHTLDLHQLLTVQLIDRLLVRA